MSYILDHAMSVIFWVMVAFLLLSFIRLVNGPTIWDRILGMNIIATKIVAIIIIYASINDTAFLLDFALIYTLSGFIGTIYIALFFAERRRRRRKK